MNIVEGLKILGLSKNEANVYVASLKLGPATAQALAAKATISRPTTYLMIESLTIRGLIDSGVKGKKKFFTATDPKHLISIVGNLKRDAHEKEVAVGRIISVFAKTNHEKQAVSEIRVFDGLDSSSDLQRDILQSGAKETFELVNIDEARKWIPPMYEGDIRGKIITKTKNRSLYTYSKGKLIDENLPAGHRSEARYLDGNKYQITGEVIIYGDRVAMTSFTPKKVTIVMRDDGIAKSMKTMFMNLWSLGEKA